MLNSIFEEQMQAKMQTPAVWGRETSYNRRFHKVGWRPQRRRDSTMVRESTMVQMYQAIDLPHRNGLSDNLYTTRHPEQTIAVKITPLPAHLVNSEMHLLVGKNEGDFVRILFLPNEGPPEIKHLRVTLTQILAKLEEAAKAIEPEIDKLFREEDDTLDDRMRMEIEDGSALDEESRGSDEEEAAMSA